MSTTYDQETGDVEADEGDGTPAGKLILVFTAEGQAMLEEDGEGVWFSDDDDDFQEQFGNEFLDADQDAAEILNYLVDEGSLDEEEKADVEIETEVDGDGDDETDD